MPGQKKWPFLPQNKFLFISACLASCKQGKKQPRLWAREPRDWWGCRAWKARLFCLSQIPAPWLPAPTQHSLDQVCRITFLLDQAGCLEEDDCKQMYPCAHVKGISAFVSAVLYDERPAPGSFSERFNSLQVLGTSMCWYSRADTQEGQQPGVSRRVRGLRHDQHAPLTAGNKAGVHEHHFPGKHPLCLKLHKAVAAKLCSATSAVVSTSCYRWSKRNKQDGHQ